MSGPVLVSVECALTIMTTAHKLATVIGLVSGYALSLRPRMLRYESRLRFRCAGPVSTPGRGRATPAMSGWTISGTLGICP
jgi:hypothetical protein